MIIQLLRSDGHGLNLEYYVQLVRENKWKAFNVRLGPVLFENLLCTHPHTAKEILNNGREIYNLVGRGYWSRNESFLVRDRCHAVFT